MKKEICDYGEDLFFTQQTNAWLDDNLLEDTEEERIIRKQKILEILKEMGPKKDKKIYESYLIQLSNL